MNCPLFYKYYDTLFANKDYAGEVAAVIEYCRKFPLEPLERILELGCGTGNHTLELVKIPGIQVTAVDTDAAMLALAVEKNAVHNSNISFASSCQAAINVDLCVALFNVVNYLGDDEQLHQFFAGIAAGLRSQGLLIFDCWNGTAVLHDPPGSKSFGQNVGGQQLSCHLTSRMDYARKMAVLEYQLKLFAGSGELIESGQYQLEHRLWTPSQIKAALKKAGLGLLTVCIPFKFDLTATEVDWKIMFACRKP